MAVASRNVSAECRATENVEPGTSRQHTGISVSVAPSCWQRAISSTSKAKPVVRSGRAAARASGPEKNLNPHWVSVASGHDPAGQRPECHRAGPADTVAPLLGHRGSRARATR